VKLCMFSPTERALERGWPGRIDGDRVVQLAAQTLQAFFVGGGAAREHAEYALDDVVLRPPVLHPPSVRLFDADDFVFANPASIHGPDDEVRLPEGAGSVEPALRLAVIVGANGSAGGYTLMNDWRAPELAGTKAHDFAISLGPVVLTPDEVDATLDDLIEYAHRNTRLVPGDVIAGPAQRVEPARAGEVVRLELAPFGVLRNVVV
jgi:2-keto-4-pentenoate hydratase/2-oxohepta-3-ene-1,7-dioic acid hydratase in catechol pathway